MKWLFTIPDLHKLIHIRIALGLYETFFLQIVKLLLYKGKLSAFFKGIHFFKVEHIFLL
uniref:Uncharacterized protein n=1 Tax=Arundo donax TaxID=35708 RepID=A0A0A9DIQ0_ARUDO